jgi:hypothetical protein
MFFSLSSLLFPLVISCFGASDDGLPVGGGKKYHETFSAYYSADGKKRMLISGGRQSGERDDTITN